MRPCSTLPKHYSRAKLHPYTTPFKDWVRDTVPELSSLKDRFHKSKFLEEEFNSKFVMYSHVVDSDAAYGDRYCKISQAAALHYHMYCSGGMVSFSDALSVVKWDRSAGVPRLHGALKKVDEIPAMELIRSAVLDYLTNPESIELLPFRVIIKDETLPVRKNLRLLNSSSLEHILCEAMILKEQVEKLALFYNFVPFATAWYPVGDRPHQIYSKLNCLRWKFSTDCSKQEFTFTRTRMKALFDMRALWSTNTHFTSKQHRVALESWYVGLSTTRLVHTSGGVYSKNWNNVTGRWGTLSDNCIDAYLGFMTAVSAALESLGRPCDYDDCRACFETPFGEALCVDGDDLIGATNEDPSFIFLVAKFALASNHIFKIEFMGEDIKLLPHCQIYYTDRVLPLDPWKSFYDLMYVECDPYTSYCVAASLYATYYHDEKVKSVLESYMQFIESRYSFNDMKPSDLVMETVFPVADL